MKDTEFMKIINGKDFTKPEDVQSALEGINAIENALLARKETAFNEKFETFKSEQAKDTQEWKNRAYVYKNISNTLDDERMSDFMASVSSRMSKNSKLKFEDAAQAVSKAWNVVPQPQSSVIEAKAAQPLKIDEPAVQPKVDVETIQEEPKVVEKSFAPSYGIRANSNISVGVDGDDNSDQAQLDRYYKYIGKK